MTGKIGNVYYTFRSMYSHLSRIYIYFNDDAAAIEELEERESDDAEKTERETLTTPLGAWQNPV